MRERFGGLPYAALASIASRARCHARHVYRANIRRTLSGLSLRPSTASLPAMYRRLFPRPRMRFALAMATCSCPYRKLDPASLASELLLNSGPNDRMVPSAFERDRRSV